MNHSASAKTPAPPFVSPEMQTLLSGKRLSVRFRGDWRLDAIADADTGKKITLSEKEALSALSTPDNIELIEFDGKGLGSWDSSLLPCDQTHCFGRKSGDCHSR